MDLVSFSNQFAEEVGGKYTEYSSKKSIFILPLEDERFQTVIAEIIEHPDHKKEVLRVQSTICKLFSPIKYSEILAASTNFIYTRFIAEDSLLKAEASFFLEKLDEELIKEMLLEVAEIADYWELSITGVDEY